MAQAELEVLQEVFPELSMADLESLYTSAQVTEYPPETTLCHQGALESILYIILDGEVEVHKNFRRRREFLATKKKGEFFGEMSLVLGQPRTADVITSSPVRLLEIDRPTFDEYLEAHSEGGKALAKVTLDWLRRHQFILNELEQEKPEVFISYDRDDEEWVLKLIDDLKGEGVNIWYDGQIRGGENWDEALRKALDRCQYMVVVLSVNSAKSRHVANEWRYFLDRAEDSHLVPVLHEPCDIPLGLYSLQYVNFVEMPYETALAKVIASLTPVA